MSLCCVYVAPPSKWQCNHWSTRGWGWPGCVLLGFSTLGAFISKDMFWLFNPSVKRCFSKYISELNSFSPPMQVILYELFIFKHLPMNKYFLWDFIQEIPVPMNDIWHSYDIKTFDFHICMGGWFAWEEGKSEKWTMLISLDKLFSPNGIILYYTHFGCQMHRKSMVKTKNKAVTIPVSVAALHCWQEICIGSKEMAIDIRLYIKQAQQRLCKLGPGTVLIFYKSLAPTPIYM